MYIITYSYKNYLLRGVELTEQIESWSAAFLYFYGAVASSGKKRSTLFYTFQQELIHILFLINRTNERSGGIQNERILEE